MSRRVTRLTKAEKIALSKLDGTYRSASELSVSAEALDSLNARELCDFSLDIATPIYRINDAGRAKRDAINENRKAPA